MSKTTRLVERLVLPTLLQALVRGVREGVGGTPDLDQVVELLDTALREPLVDMPPDQPIKLIRRAMRVSTAALTAIGGHSYAVQWSAVARYIVELTESDIITVGAGSPFASAFDAMLALGFSTVKTEDELQVDELVEALRLALAREGLFVGPPPLHQEIDVESVDRVDRIPSVVQTPSASQLERIHDRLRRHPVECREHGLVKPVRIKLL